MKRALPGRIVGLSEVRELAPSLTALVGSFGETRRLSAQVAEMVVANEVLLFGLPIQIQIIIKGAVIVIAAALYAR